MNYQDFRHNKLVDLVGEYLPTARQMLTERYKTLHTFYRHTRFTAADFARITDRIKHEADLICLDHLHFVDSDETNDVRALRGVVWQVYETARLHGKPIFAIAHTRKEDRKNRQLVPDEEDWSGAKAISEIAHKGIMIAPATDQPSTETHIAKTYMRIVKNRVDSARCWTACVEFNRRSNTYAKGFTLGRLTDGGTKFEPVERNDQPPWAQAALLHWKPSQDDRGGES